MIRVSIILFILSIAIVSLNSQQLHTTFQTVKSSPSLGRFLIPFRSNFVLPFGPFYLSPLITTSTITTTQIVPTIYTRTIDVYCLDGAVANCSGRRKRSEPPEKEHQAVYIDGKLFQPSQVSGMLTTEMPSTFELFDSSLLLHQRPDAAVVTSSMRSAPEDERIFKRQSRARFNAGQWFYATTTTVTMTAVTIVNSTNPSLIRISIVGCIPNCLTTLPHC